MTTKASNWLARWGKVTAAGLMLFLWLWSFTLAISPQLHEWLHPDSNAPEHHCVVTQIQQNQLLAATVAVAIAISLMVAGTVGWALLEFVSNRDRRLSPSRAPPFRFSPQFIVG